MRAAGAFFVGLVLGGVLGRRLDSRPPASFVAREPEAAPSPPQPVPLPECPDVVHLAKLLDHSMTALSECAAENIGLERRIDLLNRLDDPKPYEDRD